MRAMTSQEIQGFNAKAKNYRQVERLDVTWVEDEPVALSLMLRPADPSMQHTRMILRATGVRGLRLYPDRLDYPAVGCLEVRNIADRGWEDARFEVLDIEQNEAIAFYCTDLEGELRMY